MGAAPVRRSATRTIAVGLTVLLVGVLSSPRGGAAASAEEVSLPATLVTEGATPATEVEATLTRSESTTERGYGFGLSSVQWAPVPSFGLKLALPLAVRDPKEAGPSVGGVGDVSLMAKYAPLLLPARQLALAAGLKLTLPTGSERRELGGQLALAPFVAVGQGLGAWSLQADAAYSWQLNRPRRLEPEEEGEEGVRPDREQGVTANLTATYAPLEWLGLILEANSVTVLRGDETLRERVQLYLTPGVGVEPAKGWNLRAGVQLPLTRARTFDYNLIVILTKGF